MNGGEGPVEIGEMVVGAGCSVWIPAFAGMTGVGWLGVGEMVVGVGGLVWIPAYAGMTEGAVAQSPLPQGEG